VLYADTRLELPPLQASAFAALKQFEQHGMQTQVVMPALDDRYFVYILGRGVPPPKNRFRWCTPQLKVEPMERAVEALLVGLGLGEMAWIEKKQRFMYRALSEEKALMLTGVRVGESAVRDQRIAFSCTKDGAECGQGYFQYSSEGLYDTLAPIEAWRVCHVWDWLTFHAPEHSFQTQMIAEVYGGDEAQERNARTGCMECNLASKDVALDNLLLLPQWRYLQPAKRLKPLYQWLKLPQNRLRKDGTDRRADGELAANPMRMGPLTVAARLEGLDRVLAIQDEINQVARRDGRPCVSLINEEELARILQLIEANTWPQGWTGRECRADTIMDQVIADGVVQPVLMSEGEQ
jgi:DNA sulfur modification protein DndC